MAAAKCTSGDTYLKQRDNFRRTARSSSLKLYKRAAEPREELAVSVSQGFVLDSFLLYRFIWSFLVSDARFPFSGHSVRGSEVEARGSRCLPCSH